MPGVRSPAFFAALAAAFLSGCAGMGGLSADSPVEAKKAAVAAKAEAGCRAGPRRPGHRVRAAVRRLQGRDFTGQFRPAHDGGPVHGVPDRERDLRGGHLPGALEADLQPPHDEGCDHAGHRGVGDRAGAAVFCVSHGVTRSRVADFQQGAVRARTLPIANQESLGIPLTRCRFQSDHLNCKQRSHHPL